MDPNAALKELRQLAGRFEKGEDEPGDGARMGELFDALDDWLSRGGFLPQGWSNGGKRV
jgi:hypothetical protein